MRTSTTSSVVLQARKERQKERSRAQYALDKAIKSGEVAPIAGQLCIDCGKPATDYHHHNGYEPEYYLDVIALCRSCHAKRPKQHIPKPEPEPYRTPTIYEGLIEKLRQLQGEQSEAELASVIGIESHVLCGLYAGTRDVDVPLARNLVRYHRQLWWELSHLLLGVNSYTAFWETTAARSEVAQ